MQQYIPWLISGLSLLVAVLTFQRGGRKDERAALKEDLAKMAGIQEAILKANIKLDQVCSTTSETRVDIKGQARDIQALAIRITKAESDIQTAISAIAELRKEYHHD